MQTAAQRSRAKSMPGMPLQVICYERADDLASASRAWSRRARAFAQSFPDLDVAEIPMADAGAQRESGLPARSARRQPPFAGRCAWPISCSNLICAAAEHRRSSCRTRRRFWKKHGGLILSIGQFNQWVGSELMATGLVQIWPGMPGLRSAAREGIASWAAPGRPGSG